MGCQAVYGNGYCKTIAGADACLWSGMETFLCISVEISECSGMDSAA